MIEGASRRYDAAVLVSSTKLRALLLSLFSDDHLPIFVSDFVGEHYPAEKDALRRIRFNAAPLTVAESVVKELERMGVNDDTLRDALVRERPGRRTDIEEVFAPAAPTRSPPKIPAPFEPRREPSAVAERRASLAVLAIATEWTSGQGGLSTFNRELCLAWARARPEHRVLCLVPTTPAAKDIEDARARGVEIVVASGDHGLSEEARLSIRPALPAGTSPAVIVGHGRVTGSAASAQAAAFPGSRRVHVIHVAPEEIEYFKDVLPGHTATRKAEDRTRHDVERAATAELAVAVGPRLARVLGNELHARDRKVLEILPGLPDITGVDSPPPALQCLLLGRAEDYELKGLDIAARALALVDASMLASTPSLVVRGAPQGTGDALRQRLLASAARPGLAVKPREYTADAARIALDLRGSSLLLMPSRAEGFGLVGLEAIAAGVPVLLSNQSGLGETIHQRCRDLARFHVVEVTGALEVDANAWARAIERVLVDPVAAFRRAQELRQALKAILSWDHAVAAILAGFGL
jgi:glycosyltransferase involved in cell wall biosynthesis